MKNIFIIIFLIPFALCGQAKFIFEGKIEFERKINVHRQFETIDFFSESYKEQLLKLPPFHNSSFVLEFKGDESIYKVNGSLPDFANPWVLGPSKDNTIYSNYEKQQRTSIKNVFDSKYVISDSVQPLKWRISDEKRTIAGFECRKAVTIICDSVYVVAFYTEEIPVSGGPESFGGLPGMILGLAVPRLHTTWFASKVQLITPPAADFTMSTKGQKTDGKKFLANLTSSQKNWGKEGERNIWWVLL